MKAAVLEKVGHLKIKDVPVPKPKDNEVLIRVKVCGICGTDIKLYHGDYTARVPVILGHEFSGEIVEIGREVSNLKVRDKIVPDPNESCGVCNWCRIARPTFCKNMAAYGVLNHGGFAEYCVVGEKGAYKIPERLDYISAAFTEPVSCAIHAIDRADIKPGDKVLILGGGAMGQILLQLARASGASKLIIATRSEWKLKMAKVFGATDTINVTKEDLLERTMSITDGLGADVVIEAVGTPEMIEEAISLAANSGRIIIFGFSPEGKKATFVPFEVLSKELTIMGAWVNPYTFQRALDILASGIVKVTPLVSKEVTLDNIMAGFEIMEKKPDGFMKAQVKCT